VISDMPVSPVLSVSRPIAQSLARFTSDREHQAEVLGAIASERA
jgi:hypothetical protein